MTEDKLEKKIKTDSGEGVNAEQSLGANRRGVITSMQPGMLYQTNFQVGRASGGLAPSGAVVPHRAEAPSTSLQAAAPAAAHPVALNPALAAAGPAFPAQGAPPAGTVPIAAPLASLQRLGNPPAVAPALVTEGRGAGQPGLGPATGNLPLQAAMPPQTEGSAGSPFEAVGIAPAGIFFGPGPVEGAGLPPALPPAVSKASSSIAPAPSAPQPLPGKRETAPQLYA